MMNMMNMMNVKDKKNMDLENVHILDSNHKHASGVVYLKYYKLR